jgi:hypothetical protein
LSCGDLVLAREAAEDLFSEDPVLAEVDLWWAGVSLSVCVPRTPSVAVSSRVAVLAA